ncbi:MAG: hypothetical protein ACRC62_20660 [Microcoleus sp.]
MKPPNAISGVPAMALREGQARNLDQKPGFCINIPRQGRRFFVGACFFG